MTLKINLLFLTSLCLSVSLQAMDEALIVIDMQTLFPRVSEIASHVNSAIKEAKKKNEHIILVEYDKLGGILPSITDTVGKYKKCGHLTKFDMDGSMELIEYFQQNDMLPSSLTFCGLYTGSCVKATIQGLHDMKGCFGLDFEDGFKVLSSACISANDEDQAPSLEYLKEHCDCTIL